MRRFLTIIFVLAAFGLHTAVAANTDNLSVARSLMTDFRTRSSVGGLNSATYSTLYDAAQSYIRAINGRHSSTPEYQECKTALLDIYPRVADGAYYFAAQGNQQEVLRYACLYVDISILPCMGNENLNTSPRFPTLANLAATNLYNRRQYDKSITYFQAYLECGDPTSREKAFEGLARCYHEQGSYGQAANICHQASKFYPSNWNILIIGIESAGHNGNDDEMGQMLDMALRINPTHPALLEYKGKLCERRRDYEQAARVYEQLCAAPGANLEHYAHLGFNYYNAATLVYTRAKDSGNQAETARARALFAKAVPYLKTVLDNTPFATNVARALAFCHSVNQDATRLDEVNRKLQALNAPKVDYNALPTLTSNYTPSHEVVVDNLALTRDIAQGKEEEIISDVDKDIPVTGERNDKTLVAIIANAKYDAISHVDFALRDGERMKEYCIKVLGIPEDNILYLPNATVNHMRTCFKTLTGLTDTKPDQYNILVYYAGHGQIDNIGEKSFLVPVDSDGNDQESMFNLEKLYSDFDNMKARRVTVFLDACFSGMGPDGKPLYEARYVAKNAADIKARGKTLVFSAGTGQQYALPYKEKGHGFFTYFLLKELKDSHGRITLADLGERLRKNVEFEVKLKRNAQQTPTVMAADGLGASWKQQTLLD